MLSLHMFEVRLLLLIQKNLIYFQITDRYDVEDIEFREMSKSGEIRMLGDANKASINTRNNDANAYWKYLGTFS